MVSPMPGSMYTEECGCAAFSMTIARCPLHAAAPEMLGALKVTHEHNVHIAECTDSSCAKCFELFDRMLEMVPKALAKAEGRNG